MPGNLISAILMIVVGLCIRHIVGRRRFYRRNVAGIEEFDSYGAAQFTQLWERLAHLLGSILLGLGILILLSLAVIMMSTGS